MFKKLALFALATASVVLGQLTISTPPSLVQCQPVLISWSGGTSPYILDVIPGGQTGAAALENLQNGATGTSYSWVVNLASGTSVTLKITDNTGNIQYSSPLTIQAGSSSSCLNATATSAAGSAGVTGAAGVSGSAASGMSAAATSAMSTAAGSSMMAASSTMMSSAAAASSKAASSAATSKAASSVASAASSAATSAAATSGAALKNFQAPAGLLAVLGAAVALL